VYNHVERILCKLDFTRRVQIAIWVVQHGLCTPDSPDADAPAGRPTTSAPTR
jgi:hypothetical protein